MMRSYFPAIVFSLVLHAALVLLVVWGWQFSDVKPVIKPPNYIKAALVELEPKTAQKPKAAPVKKQPVPAEKLKQEQLKKQREQEKQKQAKEKQAKEKQAKEKAKQKAEQARKNQLAKEKAAKEKADKAKKEKQRKEEQRKEKEKKARQEQKKKAEALKQQALADELAKEKARLQAKEDEATVQSYAALISARVEKNWSRPPSARNGMKVELRIQLVPTGQVVSVSIIRSSGNDAFDRSAIRAIKKVDRFSELKDMPARIFERDFRTFIFSFNPQDLRQ